MRYFIINASQIAIAERLKFGVWEIRYFKEETATIELR
jgi:hypothetical protein